MDLGLTLTMLYAILIDLPLIVYVAIGIPSFLVGLGIGIQVSRAILWVERRAFNKAKSFLCGRESNNE